MLLESSGRPQMQIAAELGIQPSMVKQWRTRLMGGSLPPLVIVEGCVVALLIGVVGAAYPAYWASKLSPVQAMRAK